MDITTKKRVLEALLEAGHPELATAAAMVIGTEVRAVPDPPEPFTNTKSVYIEFRPSDQQVFIQDLNDQERLPGANTVGPEDYAEATKTFPAWGELNYRSLISHWLDNKIQHKSYLMS